MCAVEGAGGSTARARIASASLDGGCGATAGGGRSGASGAGPRRKNRSLEPAEPLCEPCRPVLGPAVLGEPPRQLLGGRLGLELGELGVLLREEAARLQLEQRGDEDEELAAGVEVEAVALGEMLDERDDDLCEIDLAEGKLVAEHERQQEIERPFERVEVEVELADRCCRHRGRLAPLPDAAFRDGHPRPRRVRLRPRLRLRLGLATRAARPSTCHQMKNATEPTKRTTETQALMRSPAKWWDGSIRSSSSKKRPKQ